MLLFEIFLHYYFLWVFWIDYHYNEGCLGYWCNCLVQHNDSQGTRGKKETQDSEISFFSCFFDFFLGFFGSNEEKLQQNLNENHSM